MIKRHGIKLLALMLTAVIMFSFIPKVFADEGKDLLSHIPPLVEILEGENETYFKVYEADGLTEITDLSAVPKDAKFELRYSFKELIDEDEMFYWEAGDYVELELPSDLVAIADLNILSGTIPGTNGDGEPYDLATWTLAADGKLKIVLTEEAIENRAYNFFFEYKGSFKEDIEEGETEYTFSLFDGGQEYKVIFEEDEEPEPDPPKATIEKKDGVYDPTTNTVTWRIEITSEEFPLESVKVVDRLGENQTYVEAYTKTNGTNTSVPGTGTGSSYEFDIGKLEGPYTFYIVTKPTDEAFGAEGTTNRVENDVDLYLEEGDVPVSTDDAKATFKTDWIKKEGIYSYDEDSGKHYITWTITLNNNNRTIPAGATVTDILPEYLSLVADSVYFDEMEVASGATPPNHGYTYDINTREFVFTLGVAIINGTKALTFTTEVSDSYFDQQNTTSFENTATLKWDGADKGSATGDGVGVPTSLIAKTSIGNPKYDPATQLITWKLEVNGNGREIKGATITDSLGSDQVLHIVEVGDDDNKTDQSIKRTDNGNEIFLESVDSEANLTSNTYFYDTANKKLIIYLGDLSETDKPFLVFQTEVTNPDKTAINGTSSVSNTAELESDSIEKSTTTVNQGTRSQVLAKEGTHYDYETRGISWRITVNQNKMFMNHAIVIDEIQEGQAYVPGSMKINGSEEPDTDGKLTIDPDNNKLTITLGEINDQVVITFKTKVTDLDVFLNSNEDVTFWNKVTLQSGIPGAKDVTVWGDQEANNKAVSNGYNDELRLFSWVVYVNSNGVPMENGKLTDQLQEGLVLDEESVALYRWYQNADGTHKALEETDKFDSDDYSYEYDPATRIFIVNLPQVTEESPHGFVLKFDTDVTKGGNYTNTITFEGEFESKPADESDKYSISEDQVNTGGSGRAGKIHITKLDENGELLGGARFELWNKSKKVLLKEGTTGLDGKLTFDKLSLDRTYYVRESRAPDGYGIDEEDDVEAVLNESVPVVSLIFTNHKQTAEVSFHKINPDGKFLEGGLFGIYLPESDVPLMTASAVAGGEVLFEGLPHGSYVIREIEPPVGYMGTSVEIPVELTVDEDNVLHDLLLPDLVNEWDGAIILLKLGDEGDPLGGVTFQLLDEGKEPIGEAVLTDKDGKFEWSGLLPGTYYLREIAGLPGYESLLEDLEVVLSDDKAGEMVQEVEVENKLLRASVSLQKVDQDGEPLSGGLFGIYDPEDVRFETPLLKVEAEEGTILFEGLLPGDYIIREIEAPKDYQLTDEVIGVKLEIGKDNTLADIELEEKLVNVSSLLAGDDDDLDDDLVETGGILDATMLWLLGILLVLMGLLFLLRLKPVKAR